MTAITQILHAVRYRISQAITKLSAVYADPKDLRRVVTKMVDDEIKALETERKLGIES